MTRIFASALLALTLVLASGAFAQQKKAANFVLKSADGTSFELSKYKGKVVVVNFWATWCGPCRREIPDFIEAYKKYKAKGVEIIGISLDQDGWAKVTPFVKGNNINYPVVLGDDAVAQSYGGIDTIPRTFVIDKKGNIVHENKRMMSLEELEAQLKPLL